MPRRFRRVIVQDFIMIRHHLNATETIYFQAVGSELINRCEITPWHIIT